MKHNPYDLFVVRCSIGEPYAGDSVYTSETEAELAALESTKSAGSVCGRKITYRVQRLDDLFYDIRENALAEGAHRESHPNDTWW